MDRRTACLALVAGSSFATVLARAQSTRAARVAWVSIDRANPESPFFVGFSSGMRSLGWVEGRNVVIDTWWAGGSIERLRKLVPEVVARASSCRPGNRVAIDGRIRTLQTPLEIGAYPGVQPEAPIHGFYQASVCAAHRLP